MEIILACARFSWNLRLPVIMEYLVMVKYDTRNIFQSKLRELKQDELRKLCARLVDDHRDTFKKDYGNLLGTLHTKEDTGLILTLSQFYDSALHFFNFQDFLLTHTLE